MLSFFPRDVLDEILNLIESVSEGFPSYSCDFNVFFKPASVNYEMDDSMMSVMGTWAI